MATAARTVERNSMLDLDRAIARQNELVNSGEITRANGQGGYTVLGRLIELRYEKTEEHREPAPHLRVDLRGLVMDWGAPQNGPLLGRSRDERELLVISPVGPLCDLPDMSELAPVTVVWNENRIPLASIPPEMRDGLKNSDGTLVQGTDQDLHKPAMVKQRFADHVRGTMGRFMVFGPLHQGLVKLAGVPQLLKVHFYSDGHTQSGFYLDPAKGEGHFLGGRVTF